MRAIGQRERDVVRAPQRVRGRDDHARAPHGPGHGLLATDMNCHNACGDLLDQRRKLIRPSGQYRGIGSVHFELHEGSVATVPGADAARIR